MDDNQYHLLADKTLAHIEHTLEPAYTDGGLEELERDASVLTIQPANGRPILVSKHLPTRQIWLASPRVGGLHFSHHHQLEWRLADGRTLNEILTAELTANGIRVVL